MAHKPAQKLRRVDTSIEQFKLQGGPERQVRLAVDLDSHHGHPNTSPRNGVPFSLEIVDQTFSGLPP
ncbi:TPA: hypothetical protein ACRXTV_006576, partial [Pseudomonas aeruginosa]